MHTNTSAINMIKLPSYMYVASFIHFYGCSTNRVVCTEALEANSGRSGWTCSIVWLLPIRDGQYMDTCRS